MLWSLAFPLLCHLHQGKRLDGVCLPEAKSAPWKTFQAVHSSCCFCCRQGVENIRNEIQDTLEPLIDPVHGHGRCASHTHSSCQPPGSCTVVSHGRPRLLVFSQSLVNLLVSGHAVSNVWDGDRECSGMSKTHTHTHTRTTHYIKTFSWQCEHRAHLHSEWPMEAKGNNERFYSPVMKDFAVQPSWLIVNASALGFSR